MPAEKPALKSESNIPLSASKVALALAAIFAVNLLLRVFYLRYDFVNGDEGVRALSAVRLLEGARLYADVVTDKPPGASLFYAAVFACFGRSMKAVHLAAILWNFVTSFVIFLISSRLYGRRIAILAAAAFVYFSTNYFTQDMMAANTELLMALPYSVAFFCFVFGQIHQQRKNIQSSSTPVFVAAGALTGVASLFKQVGVLNLLFFLVYELFNFFEARRGDRRQRTRDLIRLALVRLTSIGIGFVLVLAVFVLWLKSTGALGDFWRNAVVLNMFYIDSEPLNLWVKFGLGRGLGYLFFNSVLWFFALWGVVRAIKNKQSTRDDERAGYDLSIALWGIASLVGVLLSGRFYGHYFIPALPALSILAARGASAFAERLKAGASERVRQFAFSIIIVFFLIGLIRSHGRTAVLAYETLTGSRTSRSADWGMTQRQDQAEIVSAYVRERVSPGQPLYIWGYAHDVFWQTGCVPASRYLTPYYIDGRFADAESEAPISGEEFRKEASRNLIEDLQRTKPGLILDVGGGFLNLPNTDLVRFVEENYVYETSLGDTSNPFKVFVLRSENIEK